MFIQRLTFAIVTLGLLASGPLWAQEYGPQSKEEAAKLLAIVKSDADLHDKGEACRKIAVIAGPEVVADLAAMLGDEKLSHMIRYALEPIPSPAVDDAFRDALGKIKGMPLVGVVNSIGVRRDAKAVDALSKLLKDSDVAVACAAATSLGRIATDEAAAALAGARASATAQPLQWAVIDGSLDIAGQWTRAGKTAEAAKIYEAFRGADWPRHARIAALAGLLDAQTEGAADLVAQTIGDKDPVMRAMAISRVASLKGKDIAARLAEQLPRLSVDSQTLLIGALADRGDKAAMPALMKACSSESADVRLAAIKALGRVGDVACVDMLCKAVADGQQAAADSLRLLGGEGVDAAVVAAMKAAAPQPRAMLIEVLADRKAVGATPELIKQAGDKDAGVQLAAIKALGRIAPPSDLPALVAILISADADAVKAEAQRTVVLISRKVADQAAQADAVLAALKAANSAKAKLALLEAAGGIGGDKAFEAVQVALGDKDPAVNDAAVRALAAWPDVKCVDALLDLLAKSKNDVHRVLLLRGAVRLLGLAAKPAEQTIAIYNDLLAKAASPADKKLVLGGLGAMDDPAALKIVETVLAEPAVKGEAELAIVNIAARVMGTAGDDAAAAVTKVIAQTSNDGVKRKAQSILNKLKKFGDYVTAWQFAGPYEMEGKSAADLFDLVLAPEKADAKDVKWTVLAPSGQREQPWLFDLGNGDRQIGYVRTWIYSETDQPVKFDFGTDDGNKVWLNGKLVHSSNQGGAATPGKFKVDVKLAKGWNPVLMKVIQDTGAWQFCFRVTATDGGKIAGIKTRATPPTE